MSNHCRKAQVVHPIWEMGSVSLESISVLMGCLDEKQLILQVASLLCISSQGWCNARQHETMLVMNHVYNWLLFLTCSFTQTKLLGWLIKLSIGVLCEWGLSLLTLFLHLQSGYGPSFKMGMEVITLLQMPSYM